MIAALRALASDFDATARRLDAMAVAWDETTDARWHREGKASGYAACAAAVRDLADEWERD